jgi:UDP-2,4-diacetamido-2,4,6-trideoxy-beta-L-altropyranose hydrolase
VRYAFRVNSSAQIGAGHLVRCLALADRLRTAGGQVAFVVRPLPGSLEAQVAAAGFALARLPDEDLDETRYPWLGVPLAREIAESRAALARTGGADWLIVDSYGLDARWERAMRPQTSAVFAFDDLADRPHDVDGLLDQNDPNERAERYRALVPATARLFIGPRYAQLRAQFSAARSRLPSRDGTIRHVLVAFGSDTGDNTLTALEALGDVAPGLRVSVVLGRGAPGFETVAALVDARAGWVLHPHVESMAELMASADLALGAAGTSTWERCYLGLPAVAWAIADNQSVVLEPLAKADALIALPDERTRPAALRRTLVELMAAPERVRELGMQAAAVMAAHDRSVAALDAFLLQPPRREAPR